MQPAPSEDPRCLSLRRSSQDCRSCRVRAFACCRPTACCSSLSTAPPNWRESNEAIKEQVALGIGSFGCTRDAQSRTVLEWKRDRYFAAASQVGLMGTLVRNSDWDASIRRSLASHTLIICRRCSMMALRARTSARSAHNRQCS